MAVSGRRNMLAQTLASRRLPEGVAEPGERVPDALAPEVMPFIRAADDVEPFNPRVAFLCRKYAYKKVQRMDPSSIQRGVRQFKTYMSLKLDQDDTQFLVNDAKEIQRFYKHYCDNLIRSSQRTNFDELARYYQVSSALYEVLKDVTNNKVDSEVMKCAKVVEEKSGHFRSYKYNIVPLNFPGSSEAVLELPEIKSAIDAIRNTDGLPKPHMSSMHREGKSIRDLLDWLSLAFGFQNSNVENQRENMILLLANISTRTSGQDGLPLVDTVNDLGEKIFGNYESWCNYLHLSSRIMINYDGALKKQQLMLLHIGLYLLIWGEASNVRFMPECLCYIFHHMANQLNEMVEENYFQPPPGFEEEGSFLKVVIEPIYKVLQKESQRSKGGTAGHSAWRNYDDLNEQFWSEKCFMKLGWPWDLRADFFHQAGRTTRKPKTNFVEVRTFLHLFRSFNRMWVFFILAFQKSEPTDGSMERKIVNALQDFMEIITRDFMKDGHGISKDENERKQSFTNLNMNVIKEAVWREQVVRLHLLLTMKDSAMDVPTNLDARRRITFFANSLFMKMPRAPQVHDMISFSVLTPYYNEEVLYSSHELNRKNEDGISILFYLQKIYPDEWKNFLERIGVDSDNEEAVKGCMDDIRIWASYRGQTLARTDLGGDKFARSKAVADIKFTYVVACQLYGVHKASKDSRERGLYENILNLMLTYSALRIAYIDEKEEPLPNGKLEKHYYSVLVKGDDEEVYRIKLPGKPTEVGEGKPNNQNHAIIFTRGEALQAIDMNQDNYLEEAFKMRNLLEEFLIKHGKSKPTILGVREHIFTGRVRFHYGHPDVFDRIFHITRGGISKASKVINLSEDIFAGFNSTLRRGNVTHHEYIQLGKGRDVGMNQISNFEAKVANGNGEQTLCRDVYRLGHRFDFYRMLSMYFTTVGFYFNSMVAVLTVYVFLYGRLYLVLSGLEKSILQDSRIKNIKPFENALATQSVFQLGTLLILPMIMEVGLEKGFGKALAEFVMMQLQLAPMFFTFHLGTKTHYYGRTILHGGAKYRGTGRGFVVRHAKFAENYRMYSRSHFVKALELLILLVVYLAYGSSYRSSSLYVYVTVSMWFLVFCWLFAPFVFNPSCFEWHKTVDDWTDWWKWMNNRGGIGLAPEQSWEAWWVSEHEHLKNGTIRSLLLELILSLRLLIYQYGIVYHLHIVHENKSFMIYALSWLVIAIALVSLKVVSLGREKFVTKFQLVFRILKGIVFIVLISLMVLLFVGFDLALSDVGASILAFIPTGWFILLIAQLCGPLFRRLVIEPLRVLCCSCCPGGACRGPCCAKFRQRSGAVLHKVGPWDSIREMARMYEYTMGILIFLPIAVLSWFPFMSEFQTRLLFNQAFSRGLQISRILAGQDGRGAKRE
ncbi:hypothetical protein ACQ4PT_064158 [Festuca glaucescens]